MQSKRVAVGTAVLLALCVCPAPALAVLDGSLSNATAIAYNKAGQGGPAVMPFPDHLELTLAATASDSYLPPFGPWQDDFKYAASALGSGTVGYGSASGTLELAASSKPEFVEPTNPGPVEYNNGTSEVEAVWLLDFQENGVVTGGAPGTPVTLTFHFLIDSIARLVGGHPTFPPTATAAFSGRIIDETLGVGGGVELTVSGSEVASREFDTAVGHVVSIRGHFRLRGEALVGNTGTVPGFFPEFTGSLDAVGGLWITGPAGVAIDAPSGHDYLVPVPEPGRALLLALGAAALFARRFFTGPRSEAARRS